MRSRCLWVWLDLRDHVYIHMSMPGFGANELRDSLAEMSMVELRFSKVHCSRNGAPRDIYAKASSPLVRIL